MPLVYFGIRVTNLERSLKFYTQGLGLQERRRGVMSHDGVWVELEDPTSKQALELNYYPPGNRFETPYVPGEGLDHIGFKVDDARKWFAKLVSMGAKVALEPWVDPSGEVTSYVMDPDGNWIEVFQTP